jgi:hypothetical protein
VIIDRIEGKDRQLKNFWRRQYSTLNNNPEMGEREQEVKKERR